MKLVMAILLASAGSAQIKPAGSSKTPAALNFTLNDISGKPVDLAKYQGNGEVIARFKSEVEPLSGAMVQAIEGALAQK